MRPTVRRQSADGKDRGKMSDFEMSDASVTTASELDVSSIVDDEEEGQSGDVPTDFEPYQDEPLASSSDDNIGADAEADVDGIPLASLKARFEKQVTVDEW